MNREFWKEKRELLDDFCIKLTKAEWARLKALPTEIAVENAIHTIIQNRL